VPYRLPSANILIAISKIATGVVIILYGVNLPKKYKNMVEKYKKLDFMMQNFFTKLLQKKKYHFPKQKSFII